MLKMRVYDDDNGKGQRLSVMQKDYEVLCISQITLYHSIKGNKPDFHTAMLPKYSRDFFNKFIEKMKNFYKPEKIKVGAFGTHSVLSLHNEGPFTIVFESPTKRSNNTMKCG
uniref:D-aminoacyl-tRNA deacylase n=2 Tax=Clastoptera arizonana TaxID=38151 RepID=A0A1B6DCB0_9HEMI